jgi:hypothetical protein
MRDRDQKSKLPPDSSTYKEREPEQEPHTYPSTGQHDPDIRDERAKSKRNNKPQRREDINPEEVPGNVNREEYQDGEPVEEKSPRASL